MISGVAFDHLAIAGPDRSRLLARYAGELGGRYVVEGPTAGLLATIVGFDNGFKIELIEPDLSTGEDFLARFLAKHGPGVHHLTFNVGDLDAAAEQTEAAGFRLLGSRNSYAAEVFVHPRDASGTVVQYVEPRVYSGQAPPDYPAPNRSASIVRLTMIVQSLDAASRLYLDLLGGHVDAESDDSGQRFLDLSWPGPGAVRLVEPAPGSELAGWLGGRSGAPHHLELATDDPASVPGAVATGDGDWEVPARHNLGVALRIVAR